jgi:hypothetical protein
MISLYIRRQINDFCCASTIPKQKSKRNEQLTDLTRGYGKASRDTRADQSIIYRTSSQIAAERGNALHDERDDARDAIDALQPITYPICLGDVALFDDARLLRRFTPNPLGWRCDAASVAQTMRQAENRASAYGRAAVGIAVFRLFLQFLTSLQESLGEERGRGAPRARGRAPASLDHYQLRSLRHS